MVRSTKVLLVVLTTLSIALIDFLPVLAQRGGLGRHQGGLGIASQPGYRHPYGYYGYRRHPYSGYYGWQAHPSLHGGRGYFGRYGHVPRYYNQYPWYHHYDEGVYYYNSPFFYSYPRDIHYLDSDDSLDALYSYYYQYPQAHAPWDYYPAYNYYNTPAQNYYYPPSYYDYSGAQYEQDSYSLPENTDFTR